MTHPKSKPAKGQMAEQRAPRNPSNPTDSHRQELEPKHGSKVKSENRDGVSGETSPKR